MFVDIVVVVVVVVVLTSHATVKIYLTLTSRRVNEMRV